ncbi:hypothetical protein Desku_1106 [Desulfofundulus kuznetsovii DSM 6115]|uniref:Uncharacterized protein n=1 Tax=Desulfofundulus kuznetsovii (strain DSM 6115 / VKM B-1805 / 17) TaxID=760568 RepID=A0AAU8PXP0_DESK7|nr:hypothetical protein Desku_1106 [Desulfofundulus kuznetsovii DSM 6115]
MPEYDSGARPYGLADALAELLQGEKKAQPKGKPVLHSITDLYEKVLVEDFIEAIERPAMYHVEQAIGGRLHLSVPPPTLDGTTLTIPMLLPL